MKLGSGQSQKAAPTSAAHQAAAAASAAATSAVETAPEDKAAAKARAKQEKAEAKARAKAEKAEKKKAAQAERSKVATGGMKDFFVLHVEKLVLGLAVIGFALLIFASFGALQPAPGQSPADLRNRAADIQQRLNTIAFPEQLFVPPDYDSTARRARVPLQPQLFVFARPWDPILIPKQKRGDPELFAVEEPLASAGAAAIYAISENAPAVPETTAPTGRGRAAVPAAEAPADEDGPVKALPQDFQLAGVGLRRDPMRRLSAETQARLWVVVNALLPVARQQAEYDRNFGIAFEHNPQRDRPLYAEVRMQRLEIPPGVRDDQLDWSKAKEWTFSEQLNENRVERQKWIMVAPEIVPPEFIRHDTDRLPPQMQAAGAGVIAKPLAPLVSRSWQAWAIHPRLLALIAAEEEARAREIEAARAAEEAARQQQAVAAGEAPAEPGKDIDVFGLKQKDEPPPEKPQTQEAKEEPKAEPAPEPAPRRPERRRTIEYQLVRVFDFSVEAGKRYRYRLQLLVGNPNYQIGNQHLQDPNSSKQQWRVTPWSQATNTVAVPAGDGVWAAELVDAATDLPEKAAKVVVNVLNFQNGAESAAEMMLRRGGLAAGAVDLVTLQAIAWRAKLESGANVSTDLVLLDVRGGEKINENLAAPSQLLFVDAAGQLIVQDSVADELQVDAFRTIVGLFEAPSTPPEGTPTPGGGILFGGGSQGAQQPGVAVPPPRAPPPTNRPPATGRQNPREAPPERPRRGARDVSP